MLWKILSHCFIKAKKPTKVWIGVTDHCNSRCVMCHQWMQKGTPEEEMLKPEDYQRIFSDPYLSDIDYIIISGGEPTLREDLYEIIVALHTALPKAEIGISTNGLKPDCFISLIERLEEIRDLRFNIGVSIESCDMKLDDSLRAPGHAASANELVQVCRSMCDATCIGTMILPENIHTLQDTIQFYKDLGIDCILQMPEESKYYNDSRVDARKAYHIREFVAALPERFNMLREHWLKYLDREDISFKCYSMKDFFGVKCNGDVFPCLKHWDIIYGNLKRDSLVDIFEDRITIVCGCTNTWGTAWSWQADGWPYLKYYLRHPIKFIRKMIS